MRQKPRALTPGDTVAIVSPAGPIKADSLDEGIALLESWGLKVRVMPHVFDQYGYLAGNDRDRAADFMAAFLDPDIHAVLCSRGGYGAMRMLPHLDLAQLRAHPKPFLGYSDITALHNALGQSARMVTFHGTMIAAVGAAYNANSLRRALFNPAPLGALPLPEAADAVTLRTFVGGKAVGELVGGNLSLLNDTLGTPYELDLRGKLLLLEDVGESLYRVDRMLTHLLLAGKLKDCAGFIFGDSERLREQTDPSRPTLTFEQVLSDLLVPLGKPLVYGWPLGHGTYRATVPLGVTVELDADRQRLVFEEPALSEGVSV